MFFRAEGEKRESLMPHRYCLFNIYVHMTFSVSLYCLSLNKTTLKLFISYLIASIIKFTVVFYFSSVKCHYYCVFLHEIQTSNPKMTKQVHICRGLFMNEKQPFYLTFSVSFCPFLFVFLIQIF